MSNLDNCASSQKGSFRNFLPKHYLSYWKFQPILCICCCWRSFFLVFVRERIWKYLKKNCFYSTCLFTSCFVYVSSKVLVSIHVHKYLRYVSVLVELTRMEGTRHGRMIASQMLDVAIRVQAIRPFAVSQMVRTSFLPWKHVAISFCNKFNVFVKTLLYSFWYEIWKMEICCRPCCWRIHIS